MKKTMKRWLAMLLAVLMVMGTLPTSAWAARREEEFAEQPVIGEGDGVTDTLGKHDDGGEYPVDPVDPSDPPADLNTAGFAENITVDSRVTSGVFATATKNSGTDDNFVILIVPKFTLAPNESIETTKYITDGYAYFTGAVNKELNTIKGYLDGSFANMPFYWVRTNNLEIATSLSIAWDGSVYADGKISDTDKVSIENTYGDIKQLQKLSDFWSAGQKFYVPDTATEITGGTLPFEVFFHGTSGMGHGQLDLPISAQPLKVEILTKDAVAKTRFMYTAVKTNANYAAGEHLFTEVTLTNTTGTDMTLDLTITRAALSGTEPDNYGNDPTITDASNLTVPQMLGSDYDTTTKGTTITTAKFSAMYGLLGNVTDETKTDPNRKWDATPVSTTDATVKGGTNATAQTKLTGIVVPKNRSTTIYVAGTMGALSGTSMKQGFYGVQKDGKYHYNFWSNYKIEATNTGDTKVIASDTGGIRWVETPTTRPKVQLVHGTDLINPTLDANKGTIMDSQDSTEYTDAADLKQHRVIVGSGSKAKELTWNGTDGYVLADTLATVDIGARIYVDGWATNRATLADDATVQVPMYAVNVTDNEPHDATRKLGSYMWDSTVADTYTVKKVAYNYYPERADVGVYATKTGFSHWTGAASGSLKMPGGSSLLEDSSSAATPGQVTGLSADTDVVANYLQQIKLVTTFNGKDLGKNTVAEPGDRSTEHVFAITLGSASATVDTTGDWTRNNITVQEGTELAWTITPSAAGKYDLVINGIKVTEVDTTNLPKIDGTDYNYVVELVGVIPKVEGTTKAGSTLILPDDLNPARGRDDVTVTGAKPNTGDTPTVLFYPMESDSGVKVRGDVASGDTLSKLNYPSMDDAAKIDVETYAAGSDTKWRLKDGAGGIAIEDTANKKNMKFTASDTNPLVVTFGAADGTAKVTVVKDAGDDLTPLTGLNVRLSTSKDAIGDNPIILSDTTPTASGVYSATAAPGKYYIWIGNACTEQELTVTGGEEATATVQYWTVSVSTDGNGKATVTANDKKDLVIGGADAASAEATGTTPATVVVIEGTSVTWAFGQANDYYEADKWEGGANHNNITATVGTDTVKSQKALFKKLKATLTIHVKKGDAAANFTDYGQEIKLTTNATSATTNPVTLTETNDYTFTADLEAGTTTYYIWAMYNAAGGSDYKQVGSFTVPDDTAIEKDVNYYTLTVAADTSKDSGATAGVAYGETAPGDGTTTSIVALSGGTAMVKAFPSGSNYAWSKWESSDKDTLAAPTTQSAQVTTVTKDITLTAYFTKPKYDTYLKVTLNTNTNVTDGLVSSSDTDKDFVSVTLGTGDGAITATHVGNGVWKAAGVVDATQKDLQWYVTTRAGGPYTADQSAVADRDDATKFAEIKLYSVSTVDTDYDTAQATMTVTGATGKTRVIVEKGDEIALSVTEADGYTHVSWTEGTASKGTVAKAKYTLTGELTAEQTLTPTFTYEVPIDVKYKTDYKAVGAANVVVREKGAASTATSKASALRTATDEGKYKITGLDPTKQYDVWVNGYKTKLSGDDALKVTDASTTAAKTVILHKVSVTASTGGSASLTGGDKYLPAGATNTTGWAITATANTANGYRLGDAAGTVWAVTSGNDYGSLSSGTVYNPTLSVTTAIEGDVVATAYFTQQWTVKSTVDSDKVNSTATLTDKDSGDGTKNSPSTKTIDDTTYVKVDFNRSAGEELDGWTLANGGAGKWYTGDTPDAEGATWTDWATTAPGKTVTSFYFKPSADSTITAAVATKPYPVKIIVKLDGSDLTDKTTTVPEVKVDGKTLTYADGAWTGNFTPGDYSLTVGNVITTTTATTQTLTNIEFSIDDGEGAEGGNPANLTRTVKYWTVGVETDGHGAATMSSTNPVQSKTVNATTTSDTIRVLEGTKVTWADSTPVTNYVFDKWQEKGTDGSYSNATPTADGIDAQHTYKANFKQKLGTVTVTVKLDGQQDDKSTTDIHTVTLYQGSTVVGTAQTGKSGSYSFTNVPYNEGGTKYHVTVVKSNAVTGAQTYTALTDTAGKDIIFSGDNGDTKTVDAPYFTAIAATEGNGNASINFGGDDGTTKKTDYTDNSKKSVSFVVASGTQVTWQAHEDKANYTFDKWTEDNSTAAKRENVAVTSANKTFTAKFKKDAFNTYLYLTVNGDPYGETATDGTKDIQSVELVTAKTTTATAVVDLDGNAITPTYDDTTKVWKAEGVKSEGQNAYWRVKTVDGGVYFKDANTEDKNNDVALDLANNKAVVREPLFGVVIERGAGNDTTATYTPTLQAQVGSDPKTRIVTEKNTTPGVTLNAKTGFVFNDWAMKKGEAPDVTDTTAIQNCDGNATSFTLHNDYTPDGTDKELHIMPVYKFTTTIVTKHGDDPKNVDSVQIKEGTNVTTVNQETGTGDHTGRYTASNLDPEKTYTIIINGFPVGNNVSITKDDAGKDKPVKLYSVTVEMEDTSNAALAAGDTTGHVYVKLGATAIGAGDTATSVYLPEGAKTTAAINDATTIHLAAAAGTAYRLHNKDNTATDAYDEILWSVPTLAEALKMTIDTTGKTGTQTPNNLTIGGDSGMGTDVTVKAMFVRQYDLTVSAVTTADAAATNTEVKLTADPKGLGTVMPTPANGQSVKVTKVDAKTYIKVEYVHGVGETFLGWSYAEADGDLYSALQADGAVDTTKRIAPAAIAAVSDKTSPVYFVPKKDGAALKAVVKPAEYTVQVKVNLDNTEYPYNNGDLKVWLYTDETTPKKVTELTYNTTDKVFKGDVLPGTYRVYVNGEDLTKDPVFTEAAKNISFNADEAEGTVAGGGETGKDKLKKEINYYTVNLKADPEGTDPTQNKISFAAITGSNTGKTTDSKIFLAKAAGYDIDIYSKVYAGRGTTDTVHYRFVDWTETATTYGFVNKDADNTAYKFPKEETLIADTTNIDGTKDGKQLTLTANFKEQYKVTVKGGYNASSSVSPQVMVTGDTAANPWKTTVYVDEGGTVDLQTSGSIAGLHFQSWTIAKKAAPNETEDDGRGKFQNEDDATKYEAERGTKKANADNTTNPNNLNGFKPEDDTVIDLNLWKEPDLTDGLWSYQRGVGKENNDLTKVKKFTWTVNDAKEITKVNVKAFNDGNTYNKDLTAGVDYNLVDGKIVLTDAYIDSQTLPKGDYDITVTYTLGTTYNEVENLTKATKFYILQDPYKLTRVDIGVPTKTAAEDYTRQPDKTLTMNIDATDSKTMQAAYLESDDSHLHKSISKDDLTFTWFWAAKAPTQGTMTGTTLTNYNAGTLPTGWHKITDTDDFTATFTKNAEGNYTAVPTFTSNGTDYTDLKGNYVFAVVTATTTGEGTVITNAISVDYDATISVYEDGTLIPEAQKDHYTVYLWDANSTENFPANPAADGSKAIPANYSATDKKYHTEDSNLNAKKTYHVYVQEVEGDKTHYLRLGGNNPTTITRTANTADVYYYTVTTEAVSKETSAKNNIANATAAVGDPGETFDATPTFSVKTGNDTAIPRGNGVLQGSHVKANANKLEGKNVGWEQDYDLTWMNKGATGDYTDVTGTNKVQTSTTAVSVGYEHTQNLTGVLTITGRLTQNTYTLTGIIRDVNNTGSPSGGRVTSATLTKGEGDAAVKYNHTSITLSGFNNGVVSFVVPRGTYKLNSVEASGSTHKGHWNGGADKVWPLGHLNDAVAGEVELAELTARTPNATVADQFTIYVAATLRQTQLKDTDKTEHDTQPVSRTDQAVRVTHTVKTDDGHKIVFNYDAFDKEVIVKNTGNTPLKLKSVLKSKTLTANDVDASYTPVALTNGADTNGVTFKYTHKIAADGTETAETTPEALTTDDTGTGAEFTLQPGEARKVTIHITDKLENADDVTYRLDFTSVDGRPVEAPATPAAGPTVGYVLNIEIEPITIRRVTAENVGGTFHVQDHWLKDDALNNNQPDTDATYSAGGEAHTWAAETLGTGHTLMDHLVKQGQTVDGEVATDDPTKSDIKYLWYVADADAGTPTIDKTTGVLTFPNNKGHLVTADAGSNGTAYTPTDADHGKMLYLVAVGQRNATNAVMTPDETRFAETPVPIPYPATIRLFENKVNGTSGASERAQVSKDDGENYEVWLWDTDNGDFPVDPSANGSKAIKATATEETVDGKAYSKYVTEVILYPDHEYQVWTSAFRKTDDNTAAHYYRNTGFVIDNVSKKDSVEVDYYLVDVANTTLSQNTYATELADANIVDNSQYFYKTTDLTEDNHIKAPTAMIPAEGATTPTLNMKGNYVLNDTTVTFGFGDRAHDYDLKWGGGMTAATDGPTDTVSHKLTYKDEPKAAVTTELELRLYDVDAYVVGQGVVSRVTMTMVDGENKYTFVTDTDGYTAGANETVLLGMKGGTAVTSINTGGNATFRLPKYTGGGGYETIASHDAAYTLSGYYAKHGDSSTLHDPVAAPGEDDYAPFHKGITAADAYDIVLQGDSYDMRVTDNVNTGTKKDTSGASAKYGDGLYDQNKTDGGQKNTDGTVNQSITLNYNYGAEQNIKLTVTNETKQPELPNDPLSIYDVTFTQKKTEGGIKVSDTATNDFAGGSVDEMGRKDATDATKGTRELTLTIPDNLAVGRYEYQAEFTYLSEDGVANTGAKVTYNLVVIVEPLTFNSVDVKKNDDGKLIIDPAADKQYTVTRKATAGDGENPDLTYRDLPNTTTTDPDANSKLVQDTDYGYQWISAPVSATAEQVKAALTWNNGTLTVGNANGVTACTGADATQKVYTPKDDDSGRNLFLVIYGKDNATGTRRNATHFALSPAQTNTYKGMVALKVDDKTARLEASANDKDGNVGAGYEVWFISKNDATDKTKATWTKVGTEYAYVADLTPNDNGYSVEISRAKDDSKKVTLTGATITGTNVKTTIDTTGSNVVEAPFFTVNALAFVNKEYQTGTGEDFTGVSITPTITIGTDHAELANNTPVLSGQTVAAKAPAMVAPNADKAWTQDYTLTWRQKSDDNTATTVTDTDLTDTTTKGQSATAAIADGAYAFGTVSAKTFIGGRLDQTTYEIVGTIHGPTGNTQQVKNVTLTSDTTPAVIYYSDINTAGAGQTGIQSGVWTDVHNDGNGNYDDKVTFTVVKGTYTVTGYEDENYTIRKVTVEGTNVDSTPRNQKTFTKSVEKLAEAKRVFDIYLEATGPKLTVNDKVTTTITATSELPDHNHQFADNNSGAHYYYKQLGSDGVFTLELSNPGNVDLKLKATEVYKVKTGTDYSDSTKLQNALTAGTTSKVTITNGSGTDTVDTNRTILTFTGLPAADDDVLVGAKVSHGGTALANAGTITVSKDVYNKDDAIYVVKFASQYTTTDGTVKTGPTVYYVLDLQVEPLPIKKVTAEPDPTKTDGTLRLKDLDLDSVLVDDDLDDATDPVGAKTAGLVDADISYVWYSAPTDKTVNAADFQFNATSGALELSAAATGKDLKLGLNANTGKTYTPTDAEQGLNFYLVAYRAAADKNASDFAVSDAVYAQVTIALKAYRTGETNKVEANELPTATVFISHGADDEMVKSNDGTVTVTDVAGNANVLTFNATKTDVTATGAADDDPAAAKWYFKSWAVKPLTGDELDATDTSIETPVGGERLTMNYTATGKATVIGYFDKLPELSYKNGALAGGYVIGNDADEVKNDRTLTYTHNDGSGTRKVRVFIAPADDGKSVFGGTWADKTEEELTFGYFDTVAGVATGSSTELGVDGEYVLSREQLIKPYLKSGSTYVITFYDMEKGAKAENGYEGYDRSVTLTITAGNFDVTARAKDANDKINGNQGGVVRLYTTKPTDDTGFVKEDKKTTSGGFIQAEAKAEPGYRFVEWKVLTHDDDDAVGNGGTMTPANGKSLVVSFSPDGEGAILEASFEKAPFTPQADAKTSVYYGDDELQETDGKLVVSVTKDKDATQNFSYALATEAELTTYLNGAARPANAYTTDGKPGGDGNPNTNVVPAWLEVNADATDNTKVNFTVKANTPATGVNVQKTTGEDGKLTDAEDELVVYLKVTEDNTGESKIVPVTIDVMTSQLKIRTAGTQADETTLDGKTQAEFDGAKYKDKFIAAYGPTAGANADPTKVDQDQNEILHGSAVEAVMFEFLKIDNEKNANDVFIDEAINPAVNTAEGDTDAKNGTFENKGKWSWNPLNHTGSGNSKPTNSNTYTFTFTYDTGKDEEKWNYEGESIEIKLPVLRPKRSLLIADKVKNYADVKTVLVPGGDDDYSTIKTAGETDAAPVELDYTTDTFRKNESITYLDTEPVYTAIFQRTGVITDIEMTIEPEDGKETVGFEVPTQAQLDAIAASLTSTDDVKEATLDLTVTAVHDKVWVGEHYIRFHLTGKDDQGDDVDAYYTLSLTIDPRLITAVDVTTEYNKTEPTDVTPTIEGDPTLNDKGEDTKGNTPIKDATVTWETEDAKNPVPVKETVTVEIDPNYKIVPDDIKPETELNGKNDKDTPEETGKNPDPNTEVTPEAPAEDKTDGGKITITQLHPILMFNDQKEGDDNSKAGPAVNHVRHLTSVKVGSDPTALGKVLIDLGAYSSDVYDVDVEVKFNDFAANGGKLTPELPEGQLLWPQIGMIAKDGKTHYVMDLTGLDTSKAMAYVLRLEAKGTEKDGGAQTILATYELHLRVTPNSPPPSGGGEVCPCKVFYHVGLHGTTTDTTVEDVSESNRPSKIPTVTALDGYAFRGWSLTNPATLKQGEKIELVDPKTVTVKGDAMTFYAVIVERPFHEHYVIGYPNGNFGPADNINRASVATIIARAILPDFVEGANYGNPGGYSDVSGHWAESAIAYCSKFDVFKGYTDGTFRPDQPITRQEFATVIARLDGELTAKDIPFDDIDEAGDWAMNGIYTSYEKGWVNGYTDGTFKPLNNIRRDEAVKVFNAYLNRGVDADGLADLHEYVHTGVASNNTENGVDEYMTWPDVPKGHWAYYEIVEAANDHEFTPDFDAELGYTLPEHWEKCWIDERWRYGDGPSGGDSAAMVSAGFQVWLH